MFARVTTFSGSPEHIEEGLRLYGEGALPWMREASGFRGFVALVDRERGRSVGITFWSTRQAAEDGAGSGHELRRQIIDNFELTMESLEIFELALADGVQLDELAEQ